eukprot:TRINITY_DN5577_c0_g1_i2.p1 TRINITY_DN5577_c0_g1~~TRINITY_DN5577_c0_g1_i2.p1  ORF type:complete len:238 (-),score=40.75 TRINITY_DN5577_c0_g1_i2:103-816(-)
MIMAALSLIVTLALSFVLTLGRNHIYADDPLDTQDGDATRDASRKFLRVKRRRPIYLQRFSSTYFRQLAPDQLLRKLQESKGIQVKRSVSFRSPEPAQEPNQVNRSMITPPTTSSDLNIELPRHESEGHVMNQDTKKEEKKKEDKPMPNPMPNTPRPNSHMLEESTDKCLLCYDKSPRCVIALCGHGGLCTDCSTRLWDRNEVCYICRGNIDEILEVDASMKESGLFKVVYSLTHKR